MNGLTHKVLNGGDVHRALVEIPDALGQEIYPGDERRAVMASFILTDLLSTGGVSEDVSDDALEAHLKDHAARQVEVLDALHRGGVHHG